MTHLVDQIINAVRSKLIVLPTTGTRCYDGMPRVLDDEHLPALVLDEGDDRAAPITKFYPRLIGHTLSITARVYVKAGLPAPLLRAIRLEVEKSLTADPNLGGLTTDLRMTGAQGPLKDFESETPVAMLGITLEVDYRHIETTPDIAA